MAKTAQDIGQAQASEANQMARPRTRLTFPKPSMVPGNIGHVAYVDGFIEGPYLYPDAAAARARNVRVHIASLAILEDLPNPTK